MKALIIDGTNAAQPTRIEAVELTPTLEEFQAIVGGAIEGLPLGPGVYAYVKDEGLYDLPENLPATLFAQAALAEDGRRLVGRIHGPLVVFGRTGEDETDVPQKELDRAEALRGICQ